MKRGIKLYLYNVIVNKVFLFCVISSLAIYMLQTGYGNEGEIQYSVFELIFFRKKNLFSNDFNLSYEVIIAKSYNIYAFVFLPAICVLPGMLNYYKEQSSGVYLYIKSRTTKKTWEYSCLIANVVSSMLVLMISFSIYTFLNKISFDGIEVYNEEIIAIIGINKEGFFNSILRIFGWGIFAAYMSIIAHILSRFFASIHSVIGLLFTIMYAYIASLDIIMKGYVNEGINEKADMLFRFLPGSMLALISVNIYACIGAIFFLLVIIAIMGHLYSYRSRYSL